MVLIRKNRLWSTKVLRMIRTFGVHIIRSFCMHMIWNLLACILWYAVFTYIWYASTPQPKSYPSRSIHTPKSIFFRINTTSFHFYFVYYLYTLSWDRVDKPGLKLRTPEAQQRYRSVRCPQGYWHVQKYSLIVLADNSSIHNAYCFIVEV